MSRSQPIETNPAVKFFRWRGDDGVLDYYDKELKENVVVALPFEFLVLDELATITGFSKIDQSSYWSNEVRSTQREPFTVKTSQGIKQTGLYAELTDVRAKGAKYARSIYIVYKDGDDYVMGNIKAAGACLTAWIDFCKQYNPQNGKCTLTGKVEGKNGKTVFYSPTFKYDSCTEAEQEQAIEADKRLQVYLTKYLAKNGAAEEPLTDPFEETGDEPSQADQEWLDRSTAQA